MEVSFKVSVGDRRLIGEIVARAEAAGYVGRRYNRMMAEMDLTACHANGCELQLKELLEANDTCFAHDVLGIARHLNRDTGTLENHFLPRLAMKEVLK